MIGDAYVDGPKPLLHVVRCEEVHDTGELEEQVVLKAKDGRRPHNRGLGEDVPRHTLTNALRGELGVSS